MLHTSSDGSKPLQLKVKLNDVEMSMEVDTGATISIMSEVTTSHGEMRSNHH